MRRRYAIVSENIDEEDFEGKIRRLKELGSDPEGVYFAVGVTTNKENPELRKALSYAHSMMLEDKERFFEKYPDKKR